MFYSSGAIYSHTLYMITKDPLSMFPKAKHALHSDLIRIFFYYSQYTFIKLYLTYLSLLQLFFLQILHNFLKKILQKNCVLQ